MHEALTLTIFLLLWLSFGWQALIWLGPFSRLARFRSAELPATAEALPALSLVICARNEADNLKILLPQLLKQRYRPFEVIIVDDHSTDATLRLVSDFERKWSNLRLISPGRGTELWGKKHAMATGIKAASNPIIICTDADCVPASDQWLTRLAYTVAMGNDLVLGYSPFEKESGWLNTWARFEGLWTAMLYLGAALYNIPYMGTGRNLAYRQEILPAYDQIPGYRQTLSGDDDLLVNRIAPGVKTAICLFRDAFVWTRAPNSWSAYYRQKTRHVSTAGFYRKRHQMLLLALPAAQFGFFGAAVYCLLAGGSWAMTAALLVGLKGYLVSRIGGRLATRLAQPDLRYWLPLLEMGLLIYYLFLLPALIFPQRKSW